MVGLGQRKLGPRHMTQSSQVGNRDPTARAVTCSRACVRTESGAGARCGGEEPAYSFAAVLFSWIFCLLKGVMREKDPLLSSRLRWLYHNEAGTLEVGQGLSHEWQGPRASGLLPLLSQVPRPEAGLEAEQRGL